MRDRDLAAEEEVSSPVGLVTAIWNHAPKMEKAFAKEGIQWPNFIGSEMADLVAYIIAVQHEKPRSRNNSPEYSRTGLTPSPAPSPSRERVSPTSPRPPKGGEGLGEGGATG